MKKVVLAYSGGLDTSVAVAWLREQYDVEVVTLTVDLGGGVLKEDVDRRAISAGASRAYVVDGRERFVARLLLAARPGRRALSGRLPARHGHGPSADRPAPRRGGRTRRAPTPSHTAAPARATTRSASTSRPTPSIHRSPSSPRCASAWASAREQEIEYAKARNIEITITKESIYSIDVNLWGRSIEAGILEDPWTTPRDDVYRWTVDPDKAPAAVDIVIGFEGGVPVSLDGDRLDPVALVERLHVLAGAHGVGRVDHVEDRLVGIKSREIYEAPAATVIHRAHRALEGLTLSKDTLRFNRVVADEIAQLTYDGLWFSSLHRDLRGYAASSQRVVSGDVRVRLDHGNAVVIGRRSPLSLYEKSLATYDAGDSFDHAAAVGFIEIFGLPLRTEAARHGAVGRSHGAAWTWTDPLLAELPTKVYDAPSAAVK